MAYGNGSDTCIFCGTSSDTAEAIPEGMTFCSIGDRLFADTRTLVFSFRTPE